MLARIARSIKAGIQSAIVEWHKQGAIEEAKKLEQANLKRAKSESVKQVRFEFASAPSGYRWTWINGVAQMEAI